MALTITNYPNLDLEPVYTPFYFRLTSTLSNQPDMQYVFRISTINQNTLTVSDPVATVKEFPREDASGIYSPARILESYISYDFSPFSTGFTTSPNSLLYYQMEFGEEYSPTGTTYSFSSITNNGGYVQYNFNGTPTIVAGDVIKISKIYLNYNAEYNGLQTVLFITGGTGVVTDKQFGVSQTESGSCISILHYSTGLTTSGVCFNSARQYRQKDFDFSAYILTGSSSLILYDLEGYIRIQRDDVYTLGAIDSNPQICNGMYVVTYTGEPGGIAEGIYLIPRTSTNYRSLQFRCGPANLNFTAFNYLTLSNQTIMTDNVQSYAVSFVSGVTAVGEVRYFVIDDNCYYENIRLAWLNKLGNWSYQNFNMKSKRKVDTERAYINSLLPWNYSIGDFNQKVIGTQTQEVLSFTTAWLTEDEANDLESLWTSPVCFYLTEDEETLPFIILSKTYEQKRTEYDALIQFIIEGRYSYSQNLQRN